MRPYEGYQLGKTVSKRTTSATTRKSPTRQFAVPRKPGYGGFDNYHDCLDSPAVGSNEDLCVILVECRILNGTGSCVGLGAYSWQSFRIRLWLSIRTGAILRGLAAASASWTEQSYGHRRNCGKDRRRSRVFARHHNRNGKTRSAGPKRPGQEEEASERQ
jgi:hypothetical protein